MIEYKSTFIKYNRVFVSSEKQCEIFQYTVKKFIMLNCIGIQNNKPIYNEYYIDIVHYTDGSKNNCISSGTFSCDIYDDSELVKFYEGNYQELDKSFVDTFIIMFNTCCSIDSLKSTINLISKSYK